jgi:hypothetical protein
MHRILSRSVNKSTSSVSKNYFDAQNTIQKEMSKILLVNSKSCDNSRKNSLYKKFIQKNNENKSNNIEFMHPNSKIKLFQSSNNRQII